MTKKETTNIEQMYYLEIETVEGKKYRYFQNHKWQNNTGYDWITVNKDFIEQTVVQDVLAYVSKNMTKWRDGYDY